MKIRKVLLVGLFFSVALFPWTGIADEAQSDTSLPNATIFEECLEMEEAMVEARKALDEGDMEKCVAKYQEAVNIALEKNPRSVYRTGKAEDGQVEYMLSGIEYCQRLVMGIGEEAMETNRRLYETVARHKLRGLSERRDFDGLMVLFRQYPFTESGLAAGLLAADAALENGDYATAVTLYNKVIEINRHWLSEIKKNGDAFAVLLAKAARAAAEINKADYLEHYREIIDLYPELKDAEILIENNKEALADFVNNRINDCKPAIEPVVDDYPTFGGNARGDIIMSGSPGKIGDKKWEFELPDSLTYYRYTGSLYASRARNYLVSAIPTVSDDTLFFVVGNSLCALDAYTGRYMYAAPGSRPWGMQKTDRPAPNTFCTVHDGVAYFNASLNSTAGKGHYLEGRVNAVEANMSVGADTKEMLWNSHDDTGLISTASNDQLGDEYRFTGLIVPYGDDVLFLGQRIEAFHPNFYLICADAKNGKLKWKKFIATRRDMGSQYGEPNVPDYISVANDVAYITLASGSIVAIDLIGREIKWITRYEQEYFTGKRRMNMNYGEPNPRYWRVNYPIIYKDTIIVAPKDSNYIMCLNRKDGRVKWRLAMPDLRYIAGIDGGKLFCLARYQGQERLVILDANDKNELYKSPNSERLQVPVGRPALTESSLYISTADGLIRFDRKTQKFDKIFDWQSERMYPSNVIAVKSGLYLVNTVKVVAFNDPMVEQDLLETINKNNNDMFARYRLARAYFDAGKLEKAAEQYEMVFKKADRETKLNDLFLYERAATELNACCLRLIKAKVAAGDIDAALKYAEMGYEAAIDKELKVRTAVALGDIYDSAKNGTKAIKAYRSIIGETPDILFATNDDVQTSSHYYAAGRIGDLIAKYGRESYAPFDAEAAKASAEVLAGSDAQAHIAFITKYPNSLAANKVAKHLADAYEKSGFASMALLVYKRMEHRRIPDADNLDALFGIQRLAPDIGENAVAIGALERIAKLPPEIVIDVDGVQKSAAAFAAEKLAALKEKKTSADKAINSKPVRAFEIDLKLPLQNAKSSKARQQSPRIIFPKGERPEIMSGRVLTANIGVLRCWDAETGKMLWCNSTPNVWLGCRYLDDLRIMEIYPGSPTQKAGIPQSGKILAVNGEKVTTADELQNALDAVQPGEKIKITCQNAGRETDYDVVPEIMPPDMTHYASFTFYAGGNRLIVQSNDNRLTEIKCIDLKSGKTQWRHVERDNFSWNNQAPFAGNLVALLHDMAHSGGTVLLDMGTGKIAMRHDSIPFFYNTLKLAGDCYIAAGRFDMRSSVLKGRIYDALTGKIRCEIQLGEQADWDFRVAGESLLFMRDTKRRTRIVDLNTCLEMENPSRYIEEVVSISDKYALQYSTYSNARTAQLYDAVHGEHIGTINADGTISGIRIYGSRILFAFDGGDTLALYDIDTKKYLWKADLRGNGNLSHMELSGRYVVASRTVTDPDKPRQVRVSVFDAQTGKAAAIFEKTFEDQGRRSIAVTMAGGKLFILFGDSIEVVK